MNLFFKSVFGFLLIASIASCDRKTCQNVSCPVGQACNNGACYCTDGYEGTDCNTYAYEKFVANFRTWNVIESCYSSSPNFPSYTSYFTHNSSNPSEIEIINMLGGMCTVYAYIRTDYNNQGNIIEINSQNCGGITISGQGTYNPSLNRITFNLNYTFNGGTYQCTHTYY